MAGELIRLKRYQRVFGIRGPWNAAVGKLTKKPVLLHVTVSGNHSPVYLRVPSTDVMVYEQIFLKEEYRFEVNKEPDFIIDAGANIGFASVYFANKFPNARILAIEPEKDNFEILLKNAAPYPNIEPLLGALWSEKEQLEVIDHGYGNWGFMIGQPSANHASSPSNTQKVQGMTIDMILQRYGIDRISLLKLDIEGAEREVFRNSAPWIDKVDSLIVELHERMKPGCNRSFYMATGGFDVEWSQGEFVYLTRIDGCLRSSAVPEVA